MKLLQKPELLFAVAILVSFFLPWMKLLPTAHGFRVIGGSIGDHSGFEIASYLSGIAYLAWLIPIASIVLIVLSITNLSTKIASTITGLLPFAGVLYGYSKLGANIFALLSCGAYFSLISGLLLFLIGFPIKQSQAKCL